MININGKEYGLFYSVGVNVYFIAWVIKNPKATYVEGMIQKCIYMIKAYNDANGLPDDAPTKEEIFQMPNAVFNDILAAVEAQEALDNERKVEAKPGKNAESAG